MAISKLDEEIRSLETRIISELDSLNAEKDGVKKGVRVSNIEYKLLPELLQKRLQRDLPTVGASKRTELLNDIKEFIALGREKDYFNIENMPAVLRQLTLGLKDFSIKEPGIIYGSWGGNRDFGGLSIDVTLDKKFMKHIMFHELAHCVTPDLGPVSSSVIELPGKPITVNRNGIKYTRRPTKPKEGYEFGWMGDEVVFLRECIAESMACDLDGTYEERSRTMLSSEVPEVTSNWWTGYNRTYQQMGDEFLQTLSFINTPENDTDRKRFKALTQMAIDPKNTIAKKIDEEYRRKNPVDGNMDLKAIASNLSQLLNHLVVTKGQAKTIQMEVSPYKEKVHQKDNSELSSETKRDLARVVNFLKTLPMAERIDFLAEAYNMDDQAKDVLRRIGDLPPEYRKQVFASITNGEKENDKQINK